MRNVRDRINFQHRTQQLLVVLNYVRGCAWERTWRICIMQLRRQVNTEIVNEIENKLKKNI
jgi:hypothetical protein